MSEKKETREAIAIPAPKFRIAELRIVGTAPFVMHKFSAKARKQIIATQEAGSQAKGKKVREPKNFDDVYAGAMHLTKEGWCGVPAGAFRNAMISACRTVGYKMTHAKLAAFVLADGYDQEDETPLIRIYGEPKRHTTYARNDNGSVDIRVRPMWTKWNMTVRVRYDLDMFSHTDIVNLMLRVGAQVGIGEGRPDSKNSAGMGWGYSIWISPKELQTLSIIDPQPLEIGINMSLSKAAHAELDEIRVKFGVAAPRMVLNKAKHKDSALHDYFEWKDGAAAERYRLLQAAQIIRMYVVVKDDTKPATRGFVSLIQDRDYTAKKPGNGVRRFIDDVMADAGLRANLLETALMELRAFQRKYESLTELNVIWDSLRKVEEKRITAQPQHEERASA